MELKTYHMSVELYLSVEVGDREMDAYLTDEYMTMLQGYRAAVHAKEELKWQMESHKMRFEKWKVEQFNQRVEARAF